MRPISKPVLAKVLEQPLLCVRNYLLKDHECEGRITLDHSFIYSSRQINEAWNLVMLCAKSHSVDFYQDNHLYNKEISEWIAINQMTQADEDKYYKMDWVQKRNYLNSKFGHPHELRREKFPSTL